MSLSNQNKVKINIVPRMEISMILELRKVKNFLWNKVNLMFFFFQIKDGYTMKEIVFDWLPGKSPVTINNKLEMPDYLLSKKLTVERLYNI